MVKTSPDVEPEAPGVCGRGRPNHAGRARCSFAAGLHLGAWRPTPLGGNGSGRPLPHTPGVIPGEYVLGEGEIVANQGRRTVELTVSNTADRPIQIGSHFHFFEVNLALRFDRAQAFGMRLNVPAGTAVRFEPGDEKRVTLVELAGTRQMFGLNALTQGGTREQALGRLATW